MADIKISQLAAATALAAADTFEVVQGGISKKATLAQIRAAASIVGDYLSRPAASAASGAIYYATDVQEAYLSNGTAWTLLPTSGGELGYAETTTITSTSSSTAIDVPGLSVTCRVGEKPVYIEYGGALRNGTAGQPFVMIAATDGVQASAINYVSTDYIYLQRTTRAAALTPGTVHTFKAQINSPGSGTVDLYAGPENRAFIRVSNV